MPGSYMIRMVICAVLLLCNQPAKAQVTGIVIDVDGVITLQCLSPLQFNVTAGELATALTGGVGNDSGVSLSTGSVNTTVAGTSIRAAMPNINVPLAGDIRRLALTQVGCLVSANAAPGNVQVSISRFGNNQLIGTDGSRVNLRNVRGRVFGTGSAFRRNFRYSRNLHAAGGVLIELELLFNLRNVTRSGLHSSTVDGNFTIEVTAP